MSNAASLEFGRLGFGAAGIGNLYREVPEEAAQATVTAAWDGGIRYFDTAPHYGLGLSERRLGAALAEHPRQEYLLSSKVGRLLVPHPNPTANDLDQGFAVPGKYQRQWDPSPDGIRRSLEESLTRLDTDYLDIVYLHDPDVYNLQEGIDQALPALEKLRDEGVIARIGVGSNSAEALTACVQAADVDLVMLAGRYTLVEQPATTELLPLCQERHVGVVNVGVFNSGLLARSEVPDNAHYNYAQVPADILARAREIARICQEYGVDLPAAALQFSLRHPAVSTVVVGAAKPEQITANIAHMNAPIPEELWEALGQGGFIE